MPDTDSYKGNLGICQQAILVYWDVTETCHRLQCKGGMEQTFWIGILATYGSPCQLRLTR